MIKLSRAWFLAALPLCAQQGQPRLSFEVASLKPSTPNSNWIRAIKRDDPGRVTYENYPLERLIREAYGLQDYQIKGPAWLQRERYDITANKVRGVTADQTRAMLQSLLAERFHLVTHTETRSMTAYALVRGKDEKKLRPAKNVMGVPGCRSFGTLSEFAEMLASQLDMPVSDETGIPGTFYFILAWSPNVAIQGEPGLGAPPLQSVPPPAPPPCPGWAADTMPVVAPTIFDAVKDQMGLRLERRANAPVSVLVIDRAEKLPVAN